MYNRFLHAGYFHFHVLLYAVTFNLALVLFLFFGRSAIEFNAHNFSAFHHKYVDGIASTQRPTNFYTNLAIYDAQWYLRIAAQGYQIIPFSEELVDTPMARAYAFFPLYPFLLKVVSFGIFPLQETAFYFSFLLFVVNVYSLYWVISKVFSTKIAIKASLLFFTFPFSIFLHTYYSENVFLFLLIWSLYAVRFNKLTLAALSIGLLSITRGTGIPLLFFFVLYIGYLAVKKTITLKKFATVTSLSILPFCIWLFLNFANTQNPLFFLTVRPLWTQMEYPMLRTLYTVVNFKDIPFHDFHQSKLDLSMMAFGGVVLFLSRKIMPKTWWIASFLLWITPILTHDSMSYSRYIGVVFPLFLLPATKLSLHMIIIISTVFALLLGATGILLVNYYWIG